MPGGNKPIRRRADVRRPRRRRQCPHAAHRSDAEGDELVGAISIYRQEVRPFTDRQIDLVTSFASQAVIAVENARLLRELRQRTDDLSEALEQQTATSEVLQVITSSPGELEPVFQAMLEKATRICEASFGNLLLYDGAVFRHVALHNAPQAFAAERNAIRSSSPPLGALPLPRRRHQADRPHCRRRGGESAKSRSLTLAGARTLLIVPMLKENDLIGAIAVYRQEVRPFGDKQVELVKNFAAQAVIAIENTRLLSELRELLQQQTATADVLKVISRSTFDLQSVLRDPGRIGRPAVRCRQGDHHPAEGWVVLSRGSLRVLAGIHRLRQGCAGRGRNAGRSPDGPCSKARSSMSPDVLADPDYDWAEAQKLGGYRTIVGVPMLREGVPIGVSGLDPLGGAAVQRAADRAGQHVCRPGGHRDRERAAVRRNPGQEPPAADRERAQVALRRQHEPRAAHPAQRHHRPHRDDASPMPRASARKRRRSRCAG